jgi:hypothetical protein
VTRPSVDRIRNENRLDRAERRSNTSIGGKPGSIGIYPLASCHNNSQMAFTCGCCKTL